MSDTNEPSGRSTGSLELVLLNPNGYPEVRRGRLRAWLAELVAEMAPATDSLAVRFVGARKMRGLNRDYRRADYPTDVLSFPGETTPEGRHLGDLAVCVPVARAQAEAAAIPVETELKRLLLHGLLHCLGYDHESDSGEMRRLERHLRRRWIGADG